MSFIENTTSNNPVEIDSFYKPNKSKIAYRMNSIMLSICHMSLVEWQGNQDFECECDGKFHLALFLFRPLPNSKSNK